MIHQRVKVKEALADHVLVQRTFVFDDHGAVIIIETERIDAASVRFPRDILAGQKPYAQK